MAKSLTQQLKDSKGQNESLTAKLTAARIALSTLEDKLRTLKQQFDVLAIENKDLVKRIADEHQGREEAKRERDIAQRIGEELHEIIVEGLKC